MKKSIMIDTDILIDVARQVPEAIDYLSNKEKNNNLEISVITEMELIVGCRNKRELNILKKFLGRFRVIQIRDGISSLAADLVRQYRLSHGLLIPDALIAATAFTEGISLATGNRKDYRFIVGLKLARYPRY